MALRPKSLVLIIPAFNDWDALRLLIPRVDGALTQSGWNADLLIVDDGSTELIPADWPGESCRAITTISVLHLRANMGHQRAIALGLYHAHEFTDCSGVLVMDGDGEDRAEDVPALLAEFERGAAREAVFAARTKRMEGLTFQASYHAFRLVHWLLTGIAVRVGNFSVLPRAALTRLMVTPDVWNHFAAAVYKSRFPRRLLPLARGSRLAGQSTMIFVSLLVHGLSAMSVFSDQISARMLVASLGLSLAGCGMSLAAGWSAFALLLVALGAQSLAFAALFALTIVGRRNVVNFLLLRDARYFILGTTRHPSGSAGLAQLDRSLASPDAARKEVTL